MSTSLEVSYFVDESFYRISVDDCKGPALFLLRICALFSWFLEPSFSSVYDIRDLSSVSWSWNYCRLPSMLLSLSESYCSGTESSVTIHKPGSTKQKEAKRWRPNHIGANVSSRHWSQFLGCARCKSTDLKDTQKMCDEEKSTTTRQSSLLRHHRDDSLTVLYSTLNIIPCVILPLRIKWKYFSGKRYIEIECSCCLRFAQM